MIDFTRGLDNLYSTQPALALSAIEKRVGTGSFQCIKHGLVWADADLYSEPGHLQRERAIWIRAAIGK
ncbi:hypothetical protein L810_7840 [Burkholderia sp. AU4i]|nr:hypothetical protein L810_7840 [Burkholderia sp. AU4i]